MVEVVEVETTSQVESISNVEQASQEVKGEDSDYPSQTNSETDSRKQGFAKCNSNQENNLCTLFAKEVGDLESERSLDRHIGHSRKVAQIH